MGKGLGVAVIAEGVETEAQRALLAAQGCDLVQGHAISEPLGCDALQVWAARQ